MTRKEEYQELHFLTPLFNRSVSPQLQTATADLPFRYRTPQAESALGVADYIQNSAL